MYIYWGNPQYLPLQKNIQQETAAVSYYDYRDCTKYLNMMVGYWILVAVNHAEKKVNHLKTITFRWFRCISVLFLSCFEQITFLSCCTTVVLNRCSPAQWCTVGELQMCANILNQVATFFFFLRINKRIGTLTSNI